MSPSSRSTIPQRKRKLSCGSGAGYLDVLLNIGEDAPDTAPWKTGEFYVILLHTEHTIKCMCDIIDKSLSSHMSFC
jgi:hypothetical protein